MRAGLRSMASALTLLGAASVPAARFGGGSVPPTRGALRCENAVVRSLARNAACLDRCTLRAAARAFRRDTPFDDEACEGACGAALVRAARRVFARGGCPACLERIPPELVATLNEQASNAGAGLVACAGTTPLGGDDAGFVPPDRLTARCEFAVGRTASRFDRHLLECYVSAARAAFAERPFDLAACAGAAERRYTVAVGSLDGCPDCLDERALATRIRSGIETGIPLVYCASPGGAFVADGR